MVSSFCIRQRISEVKFMAPIFNLSFGLDIIFHLFVGKKWSNIWVAWIFFALNNVEEKLWEKIMYKNFTQY